MSAKVMTSFTELAQFAGAGRLSLPGETIGYLVLLLADQIAASPRQIHPSGLYLEAQGKIVVQAESTTSDTAERGLRRLLAWLLSQVRGESPNLRRVADRSSMVGLHHLVSELEAALVPVNRRAGERSLARLSRDAQRERMSVSRDFAVVSQPSWLEETPPLPEPRATPESSLAADGLQRSERREDPTEWAEEVAVSWEPFNSEEQSPGWQDAEEALTRALPVSALHELNCEATAFEEALTGALPAADSKANSAPLGAELEAAYGSESSWVRPEPEGRQALSGPLRKLDALARLHLFQSPEPPDEYSTAEASEALTRDLREFGPSEPKGEPMSAPLPSPGRRPFVLEPLSEPDPDRIGPLLESRKAEPFRPSDVGELSEQLVLRPRSLADLYQDLGRMARVDHSPEPPAVV